MNRMVRTLALIVLVVIAGLVLARPLVEAGRGFTANLPAAKIEPRLLDQLATEGAVDFIVHFAAQSDLSSAQALDWTEAGWFVYHTLQETAARSQAAAHAYLEARGFAHTTFIAGNELYVHAGTLDLATALADWPEIAYIRAPRTYFVDPIMAEAPQSPDAMTWGVIDVKADQFWGTFSVQGHGIVVASIDTGVQWNHPALAAAFKCGGNPADPACWSDPANVCGGSACDNNGHGTHTVGTMVGDDNPALTYQAGVAPRAQWIACKGCESNSCSEFALNACADWLLAPAGNPNNRPHVVNNSWGGRIGTCDTWYYAKVQSWVAAGIFPAFSAGNSGDSGCTTLGVPGVYQEAFATAAHNSSRAIASFSSRGPAPNTAPCHPYTPYVKPNISAPGVNVCSSVPTNSWACINGTSMASPHVAGAVALLWSCNAALIGQIDTTFQLLQSTANAAPGGNCGGPPSGPGNYTYGYGFLDALAAGVQGCGTTQPGTLAGYVRDTGGGPLAGATVTANPGGQATTTGADGAYAMSLLPNTYSVTAAKAGYESRTANGVVIVAGQTTVQNFNLPFLGAWIPSTQPNCFDLTRIDAGFHEGTGKVYVLGGRSGVDTVGTIYAFDPVANTCAATGATMPTPISNYTVNLVNNGTHDRLCTFGGRDAAGNQTLAVQCYNPVTNAATQVATLPAAYTGYTPGAQVVVDNRVYILGGFNPSGSPYELARTDRFNPLTNTFTQVGDLSLGRAYLMAAAVDGAIYAFGGTVFDGANLVAQVRTETMADPGGAATWNNGAVAEMPQAGAEGRAFGLEASGTLQLQPRYAPAVPRVPDPPAPGVYDPAAVADLVGGVESPAPAPAGPVTFWAYPTAVLWDNGPLVTHPGNCGGMDASRLQTDLSMNTLGFGHQFSLGYRMADNFEVTSPSGWQLDTIVFFAYQTGAPSSPSPITGLFFQIWDGPPNAPGSSVVFGNLTTNRLVSSASPNLQRDSGNTPCADTRYVFANTATAGVTLPPGTYWLDWMTDGSLASGPWAPPVTIPGQTTTGNGLQYTTDWAPALDTGTSTQQDLPFIITGTPIGGGGGGAGQVILAPAYAQWPGESSIVVAYDVATDTYDGSFPDLNFARRNNAGVLVTLCTASPTDGLPGMWVLGGRSGSDNPPYAGPEYYPLRCGSMGDWQVYMPIVFKSP